MGVQVLLQIFGRFPQFFLAVAKQCSTALLQLLGYLFSCWNAPVRESMENGTENGIASTAFSTDSVTQVMQAENNSSIGPATMLCSEVGGVSEDFVLHLTQAIPQSSTPAAVTDPEVGDTGVQPVILLNTASDDVELRPLDVLPQVRVQQYVGLPSIRGSAQTDICNVKANHPH
ncbi:hypothetical protein F5J12DRAFT_323941 [Pisolithus orientalis]|uniref:uncharacterized protein n=1 Tax=Pisolithus orientalis TaxID=936130 RepID=UPI002224D36A|nr:uncharacterized protein F5J12DRAFT_323941 [Pisolithus orientalis]KAI5998370.1 hypothetical protein F5J12DRAFT_323941 [Pisolithus orientalis]